MEFVDVGRDKISRLGVGTYSLSGVYGEKDLDQFRSMLKEAITAGVNLIDTAPAYGSAEKVVGEVIAPRRDQLFISTKTDAGLGGEGSLAPADIKESCHRSLRRLNTDYVDIYHVHYPDPETEVMDTIQALEELKQSGLIREYGLSHLPRCWQKQFLQRGDIFSMMGEYNLLNQSYLLQKLGSQDMLKIAFSVTGRGLLTDKFADLEEDVKGEGQIRSRLDEGDIRRIDPQFRRDRLKMAGAVREELVDLSRETGHKPVQLAAAWVLAQEEVDCILGGPGTPAHFQELRIGAEIKLDRDIYSRLEKLRETEQRKLEERSALTIENIITSTSRGSRADKRPASPEDFIYALDTIAVYGELPGELERDVIPLMRQLLRMRGADGLSLKGRQGRIIERIEELYRASILDRPGKFRER